MANAVAYYRMSTDKQDASIPAQREAVERFAAQNGYKILREYRDDGISGNETGKRLGFQQMIADAADFEAVIVWDLSRLGRFDMLEAGRWLSPLRDAGVTVVTVDRGPIDWSDFGSMIVWGVEQQTSHKYLTDLSRNVSRGMGAKAATGIWQNGRPPFGYRVNADKRLEIDEDTAQIVRRIFKRYLAGDSMRAVTCDLNTDGIPSPRAKEGYSGKWSFRTIGTILGNEVYTGVFTFGKGTQSKYYKPTPSGPQRADSATSGVFRIENNHPAIIKRADFERTQEQRERNKNQTTPFKNGSPFVLTGLMICSHCGRSMAGCRDKYGHAAYVCGGYHSGGRAVCQANRVGQDRMVSFIAENLQRWAENNMGILIDEIRRQAREQNDPARLAKLRKKLAQTERELQDAEKRLVLVDADMMRIVQDRIRELRGQRQDVTGSLRAAEMAAATIDQRTGEIIQRAERMAHDLHQAIERANPAKLKAHLRTAIRKMHLIFDDRKLSGGKLSLNFPTSNSIRTASRISMPRKERRQRSPTR